MARLLLGPATPRRCRAARRRGVPDGAAAAPGERRSAAARRMHAAGVDACLVADGERVLGIVTATDVLTSLAAAELGRVDGGLGTSGEAELAQ